MEWRIKATDISQPQQYQKFSLVIKEMPMDNNTGLDVSHVILNDSVFVTVEEKGTIVKNLAEISEPAGAAAYAGLVQAARDNLLSGDERIVVLNTGNGLKDVAGAMQAVKGAGTQPDTVSPDLEELKRVVADWKIG